MDTSPAIQLAETIQTASIEPNPDPRHDLNPTTSASSKQPVKLTTSTSNLSQSTSYEKVLDHDSALTTDDIDVDIDVSDDEEDIPYSVLQPIPRRQNLPPLPDMRFEQSYLKSLENATTPTQIAYITIRDQVILPLLQGTLYSLALLGWRHWNRATKLSGNTVGARVRRWWWGVNNWSLDGMNADGSARGGNGGGKGWGWLGKGRDARGREMRNDVATRVGEFYENQSSAGGD